MQYYNYFMDSDRHSTYSLKPILILIVSGFFLFSFNQLFAGQLKFKTPQEAANKLYEVIINKDTAGVRQLFGSEHIDLLPLDKIEPQHVQTFIKAWKHSHGFISIEKNKTYIKVGKINWTFPIPLEKTPQGWFFNTVEGSRVITTRQIGRNELAVIEAIQAYSDAQKEYAEKDYDGDGKLEYAQQFISSEGKRDGLYWPVGPNEPLSPLGHLFSEREPEKAYHGYYYKILTAQGNDAPGGEYSYLLGNNMVQGFAILAWPAEYGKSGIMSFQLNHEGIVYEANLGRDTDTIVKKINQFNPDSQWVKTQVQ
jgi:hypothetical protein